MKRETIYRAVSLFYLMFIVPSVCSAQNYFPDGTRWMELRLDTIKYESWYSPIEYNDIEQLVPNFEQVEYYVKGDTVVKDGYAAAFKKVYRHMENKTDSIAFLLLEKEMNDIKWVLVSSLMYNEYSGTYDISWPTEIYDFDWSVGKELRYHTIISSNATGFPWLEPTTFGIVDNVKEGIFGGTKSLKYVDVEKGRILEGIGITSWNDRDCLFGPARLHDMENLWGDKGTDYRSILVRFERDGELLYNMWPNVNGELIEGMPTVLKQRKQDSPMYNLQGRRLQQKPQEGIYIKDGKKYIHHR